MNLINTTKDMNILTNELQNVEIKNVIKEINDKGYFIFKNAFTHNAIEKIEREATELKVNINQNKLGGVYFENQYYFTNLLSVSKTFYDFVTSNFVYEICKKYMGEIFRLKALRYYETYGGHHMQWHTDNKTDKAFAHIPGIIFIFYISDVKDGEFQYIEGSHKWSGEKAYSNYNDDFIEKNYKEKIKSFKLPKGSLIIYNTYGIHRAKPVKKKGFVRKSVFFQIDNKIDDAEPIIVNTKFIDDVNDQISMFLGFGKPSNYEVFPKTSLNTLPINKKVLFSLIRYFPYRLARNIFNNSPILVKKIIKQIFRNNI